MSKLKFILFFFILTPIITSCSDDKINLNAEEILLSKTWIKHSHQSSNISDGFEEFIYKDEYTFNSDGTCIIKGINIVQNEDNVFVVETIETEDEWWYNEETNTIDFKVNDYPVFTAQFDWEILKLTQNKIIVRDIFPEDIDIESRILLIAKE